MKKVGGQVSLWIVLVVLPAVIYSHPDAIIMRDITMGFGEALEECRKEHDLSNDIMEEFFHMWGDGFQFIHRDLGCTIVCMANKHNVLHMDDRLHQENMEKFINNFPRGEQIAKQLVSIIEDCERTHYEEESCERGLRVIECFKEECIKINYAPGFETFMELMK